MTNQLHGKVMNKVKKQSYSKSPDFRDYAAIGQTLKRSLEQIFISAGATNSGLITIVSHPVFIETSPGHCLYEWPVRYLHLLSSSVSRR